MRSGTFQKRLDELSDFIGPQAPRYKNATSRTSAGDVQLDQQLTQLADLFMNATPRQRETIRSVVQPRALSNLLTYIHRVSITLLQEHDTIWLQRALAAAVIIGERCDYRDLIVSLVIVRVAAERVGIDHVPHFNSCIEKYKPSSVEPYTNARDHRPSDVRDILRHFGPPELKPTRKRRKS